MKRFGATIRELRQAKGITLRAFAEEVGISPAFQSKMERDDFDPPGEKVIRRMAELLDQDPDELLGLGGKISSDLPTIIKEEPHEMAALLRTVTGLSPEALGRLRKQAEKLKKNS